MESTKKSSHMKFGILVWALIVLCSLYVCIRVYYPYYPDIRIYGRADNGTVLVMKRCDSYYCDQMIRDMVMNFHGKRVASISIHRIEWFTEPPTFTIVDIVFLFHIATGAILFAMYVFRRNGCRFE